MSKKQQIAEAERRFENWWDTEGGTMKFINNAMGEELEAVKKLAREAWMNGAFVAMENN